MKLHGEGDSKICPRNSQHSASVSLQDNVRVVAWPGQWAVIPCRAHQAAGLQATFSLTEAQASGSGNLQATRQCRSIASICIALKCLGAPGAGHVKRGG